MLDGEKMLEVTRKLFRSTERDPDRDLRKQVLLKTALKNLPHFVHYQHCSSADSYHERQYEDHFDAVSLQQYNNNNINTSNDNDNNLPPNAIEVSTTSMRMLDLNDDSDHTDHHLDRTNMENDHHRQQLHHTSLNSHLDEEDDNELSNNFENSTVSNRFDDILFNRHNSFDNLYQPNDLNEINDPATDAISNNHISWNIGYKIFEFPSIDAVSKASRILDEEFQLPEKQHDDDEQPEEEVEEDSTSNEPTLDNQQCAVVNDFNTSSSSADESLTTSDASNEEEQEQENRESTTDLSQSIENSFYSMSSSPRSNKRPSSFIYADSMDIDLVETSQLFDTSPFGQFKRLRKTFEKQTAPLIETTTGGF